MSAKRLELNVTAALSLDTESAAPAYFIPESDSSDRRVALFIFLFGCCYLWLFRRYTMMDPDEGIILQGAQRILDGQVLYRDFFSFLTPGSFYQTALLLRTFGDSIITARTALVVIGATLSTFTYLLARRVCSRAISVSVAVVSITATLPYRFVVLHNWDSTLWVSLATYAGLRWFESARPRWAFVAGTASSLALLCEQSKGVGVLFGIGITLIAVRVFARKAEPRPRMYTFAFVFGLALPIASTIAYFGAHHALAPMLSDLLWPFRHYSSANRVPYGYQNWTDSTRSLLFGSGSYMVRFIALWAISPCFIVPALPLISVGLLIFWLVRLLRANELRTVALYYVYLNTVFLGLLLSILFVRADIVHFMYVFPLLVLVIAWFMQGSEIALPSFKPVKPLALGVLTVAFFLFSSSLLFRVLRPPVTLKTRRGVITLPRPDEIVTAIQVHSQPGAKVLVYPYAPLYYYLTETVSPSAYDFFQVGMNTPEQAEEILSRLKSDFRVSAYFEFGFAQKIPGSWPATPLNQIAVDPVADYLIRNYSPCKILHSASSSRFLEMSERSRNCKLLETF